MEEEEEEKDEEMEVENGERNDSKKDEETDEKEVNHAKEGNREMLGGGTRRCQALGSAPNGSLQRPPGKNSPHTTSTQLHTHTHTLTRDTWLTSGNQNRADAKANLRRVCEEHDTPNARERDTHTHTRSSGWCTWCATKCLILVVDVQTDLECRWVLLDARKLFAEQTHTNESLLTQME